MDEQKVREIVREELENHRKQVVSDAHSGSHNFAIVVRDENSHNHGDVPNVPHGSYYPDECRNIDLRHLFTEAELSQMNELEKG